jgi:NADPH:quinone reductase-like Zn-dependent oxidoreductase
MGAGEVVARSDGPVWPGVDRLAPDGFDAVFESNGVATIRESWRRVRPTGRLVVYGHASMLRRGAGRAGKLGLLWRWLRMPRFDALRMTNENRSLMAFNLSYLFDERETLAEAMGDLLGRAAAGTIAPVPVTTYPLDRVADAHRDLESGETTGKLILLP